MNIEQKSYVKWARPYLNKKNAAAMTKKRAIKIIMAATCCGNRSWAEDMFMDAKSKIAGKPRNVDVCYRVICCIYNISCEPEYEKKHIIDGVVDCGTVKGAVWPRPWRKTD